MMGREDLRVVVLCERFSVVFGMSGCIDTGYYAYLMNLLRRDDRDLSLSTRAYSTMSES